MKKGPEGGLLRVLSDSGLSRIHEASLSLLEDVGIATDSDLILKTFSDAARIFYKWFLKERMNSGNIWGTQGASPGMPVSMQRTVPLWETYFDPLYAQD